MKQQDNSSRRTTIKYLRGRERCPKCGGAITYGSSIADSLPIGFGFVGARFQIDILKRSGHGGECMDCGQRVFAVVSQRHVTKFPKLGKKGRKA
jgi:ribosomal protein L34E